jgi:acetyltransferase EpsM
MKKVVIMGGKGMGMIAAAIIEILPDVELLGFLNDGVAVGETQGKFNKIPVIGTSEDVQNYIVEDDTYVIAAYKTMGKEKEQFAKLNAMKIPSEKWINIFHPSVQIPTGFCYIGNGVMMAPNVQLSVDSHISDNCILLGNCFIGHDSILEQYVTVANHATIGARVKVGKGVHIGTNATIRQGVTIGDFSLVGMGAVVLKDVPPGSTAVGNPARILS